MSKTVTVKFGKNCVEVQVDCDATTEDVKHVVEERTGVIARKQKLMFKGKVLVEGETLEAAGIGDGAKIMGIATEGTQTQGQAMGKRVDAAQRLARAKERMQNRRRALEQGPQRTREDEVKNWTTTKIIACRDLALEAVPEHALEVMVAEVADFSHNVLQSIPAEISCLAQLRKLDLRHNQLNAQGLGPSLGELCNLQQLYLDHNRLEELPFILQNFITLEKLTLSNNTLKILPDDFHHLRDLTELDLSCNALTSLPPSLGRCMKLKILNVNNNRLTDIPESFSSLTELQTLRADHNRIDHVRSSLLKDCLSLSMLSLHHNPLVMHRFREIDGFLDYERRRQRQYDKKLHTGAMQPGERFDEGADHSPSR